MDIKIITYNVKCFPWLKPPIAQIVRWLTENSEIVCLQEIWCRQDIWTRHFEKAGWSILWPPRDRHIIGFFGCGLAIAYKNDTWKLTPDSTLFYPYLHSCGIDSTVPKGWMTAMLTKSSSPIIIINTHLQANLDIFSSYFISYTEAIRRAQFKQLWHYLNKLTTPFCVLGDFNTEICWWPSGKWLSSNNNPTFQSTDCCIDHLYCNMMLTLFNHTVHTDHNNSDHWPVSWHFRLYPLEEQHFALKLQGQLQSHQNRRVR